MEGDMVTSKAMADIKICELSIGDWVNVDDPFHSGAGQIVEIRSNVVLVQVPSCVVGARLRSIEPIPLTPEILEKNGFVYSKVTRWYNCEIKDTQRTRIGVHYGLIGADRIELSSGDAFNEDWSTIDVMINKPIEGVHQLQHALRLAGVEKEIEV